MMSEIFLGLEATQLIRPLPCKSFFSLVVSAKRYRKFALPWTDIFLHGIELMVIFLVLWKPNQTHWLLWPENILPVEGAVPWDLSESLCSSWWILCSLFLLPIPWTKLEGSLQKIWFFAFITGSGEYITGARVLPMDEIGWNAKGIPGITGQVSYQH